MVQKLSRETSSIYGVQDNWDLFQYVHEVMDHFGINCPPSCNPINLSYRAYSRLDCLLRCTEFSFMYNIQFVSGTEHTFLSGSIIITHWAHTYFLVLLQPLHRPSLFLASVQCVHLLLVLLYCTESTVISGITTVYRVHAYFIALFIRCYYSILFYA